MLGEMADTPLVHEHQEIASMLFSVQMARVRKVIPHVNGHPNIRFTSHKISSWYPKSALVLGKRGRMRSPALNLDRRQVSADQADISILPPRAVMRKGLGLDRHFDGFKQPCGKRLQFIVAEAVTGGEGVAEAVIGGADGAEAVTGGEGVAEAVTGGAGVAEAVTGGAGGAEAVTGGADGAEAVTDGAGGAALLSFL